VAHRLRPSQVPVKAQEQAGVLAGSETAMGGDLGTGQSSMPSLAADVLKSPGQALDPALRAFMEPRFGRGFNRASSYPARSSSAAVVIGSPHDQYEREADAQAVDAVTMRVAPRSGRADFSNVRVHADSRAADAARAVGARAYTVGHHIVFGAGEYAPETGEKMALLAHELTHVQQGRGGSLVLRRQPKGKDNDLPGRKTPAGPAPKPRDPEAEVRKIISGNSAQKELAAWLDAHPADLTVAEKVLLDKAAAATVDKEWNHLDGLPEIVFARDPNSGTRTTLRSQAKMAADEVWKQYATASAAAAINQWTGDNTERARLLSKFSDKAAKADKAKQIGLLHDESAKFLEGLQKDRMTALGKMQRSLSVLPLHASAAFTPEPEQDLVTSLLHQMERGIAHAEGVRRQSYELYSTQTPEGEVSGEIKSLDKQRDVAEESVKTAQQELEAAKKLTGTSAAARVRAATAKVKQAEDRRQAVTAKRAKATPAAARAVKYREDPQEKQRVDAAFNQSKSDMDAFTRAQTAKLPSFDLLADDHAKWWVYWQFVKNAREGFGKFSMESILRPLLLARNKMIIRPDATGIHVNTFPDTYSGHGWGQYDLGTPAGEKAKIDVVEPREIDLAQVLGGKPRMFEWMGSKVSAVFGQDPRQTEKDVLDKLAYGFFGRDREFEKKIQETDLDGAGLPKNRTPDPARLVAGLIFRGTVEGAELEIEDRLVQLRADLEQRLEDSPELAGLRVNEAEEILPKTFDASSGDFGTPNLLNRAAFLSASSKDRIPASVLKAFDAAATRILKEDNDFTRAVFTLMKERLQHLRSTGGVEAGHLGVLDWAGPSVYVLHQYRLKGGTEQAWIQVIYLHLHKADAKVTTMSKNPLTVGEAGSAGAAISPHVHMSIAVFRTEPSWNTPPVDYIDPTDFFGMVPRTPFRPVLP
jgi:hypothetical protein